MLGFGNAPSRLPRARSPSVRVRSQATQSASFSRLILDELISSERDQSSQIDRARHARARTPLLSSCQSVVVLVHKVAKRSNRVILARRDRDSTSDQMREGGNVAIFASWPLFNSPFPLCERRADRGTVASAPPESVPNVPILQTNLASS